MRSGIRLCHDPVGFARRIFCFCKATWQNVGGLADKTCVTGLSSDNETIAVVIFLFMSFSLKPKKSGKDVTRFHKEDSKKFFLYSISQVNQDFK